MTPLGFGMPQQTAPVDDKKTKQLHQIEVILSVLLIGVVGYFLMPGIFSSIKSTQGEINSYKKTIENLNSSASIVIQLKESYSASSSLLQNLSNGIAKSFDPINALLAIQAILPSSVKMDSFQFNALTSTKGVSYYPITLSLNSDYQGMKDFLNAVANSSTLMDIKDFAFTQGTSTGENGNEAITFAITTTVAYYTQEQPVKESTTDSSSTTTTTATE